MEPVNMSSNADLTRQTLAALSVGDRQTLRNILDEKIVMEVAYAPEGVPTVLEGIGAVFGAIRQVENDFSFFNFNIHELYECGAQSVVIAEATSFARFKVGGAIYQNRYVFVFRFVEGHLVHWCEYFNPMQARTPWREMQVPDEFLRLV